MKSLSVTDDSNESYETNSDFPVVLLIMLCKVVLSFESVNEILKCDHSNESYGTNSTFPDISCCFIQDL